MSGGFELRDLEAAAAGLEAKCSASALPQLFEEDVRLAQAEVGPISLNCTQVKNVRVHDESLHCTWGLVSRDGWVVVNDTASPALDPTTGWWNVGMTKNAVDWYFFGHGHDYRGALTDYTKVCRTRSSGAAWSPSPVGRRGH